MKKLSLIGVLVAAFGIPLVLSSCQGAPSDQAAPSTPATTSVSQGNKKGKSNATDVGPDPAPAGVKTGLPSGK